MGGERQIWDKLVVYLSFSSHNIDKEIFILECNDGIFSYQMALSPLFSGRIGIWIVNFLDQGESLD